MQSIYDRQKQKYFKEIEKIEKYSQKDTHIKIAYNSVCVCVCADYIICVCICARVCVLIIYYILLCVLVYVIISMCVCVIIIHGLHGRFKVALWIYV